MRYAVLSDLHSNIEAVATCLARVDELGVDQVITLGDLVGYNADPNEVVDIIRERRFLSIMGNHDVCACGLREPVDFNPIARDAILWTRRVLTPENNQFLTILPDARRVEDRFLMVHGAVTHRDNYIFNEFDARESFQLMREKYEGVNICFFGHTHRGVVYKEKDGRVEAYEAPDMKLDDPDALYLVNPGSVGQPRDGDPRSSFVTYDDETLEVTYHRLDYDVPKSSRKVVTVGAAAPAGPATPARDLSGHPGAPTALIRDGPRPILRAPCPSLHRQGPGPTSTSRRSRCAPSRAGAGSTSRACPPRPGPP